MNLHNLEKVGEIQEQQMPPRPMNVCKQCGTVLSCGCQKLIASDGTEVCDECISAYEEKLNSVK